jgi:hypothetical protein
MVCSTHFQREDSFPSEINIHFRGLENLGKDSVFVFPSIRVCLDCGHTEFEIPKEALQRLVRTQRDQASA